MTRKSLVFWFVLTALVGGALYHAVDAAPVEACVSAHTSGRSELPEYRAAFAECQESAAR